MAAIESSANVDAGVAHHDTAPSEPAWKRTPQQLADAVAAALADPLTINDYGQLAPTKPQATDMEALLESGPVRALATSIAGIIGRLREADPRVAARKPTRLEKLTGANTERVVLYHVARSTLDTEIETARIRAVAARIAIRQMDASVSVIEDEICQLDQIIEAAKAYLRAHPNAGRGEVGALHDSPRERLERRIANLGVLRLSHVQVKAQMALAKGNAVDLLDRFAESVDVLVPVWRQNAIGIANGRDLDPEQIASATGAHDNLLRELSKLQKPAAPNGALAQHDIPLVAAGEVQHLLQHVSRTMQ